MNPKSERHLAKKSSIGGLFRLRILCDIKVFSVGPRDLGVSLVTFLVWPWVLPYQLLELCINTRLVCLFSVLFMKR